MQIKHGLVSCDSHGQLDRDAWTSRMSKAKWGDRIPRVIEVEDNGEKVERWTVNGKVQGGGVVNCPAAMHEKRYYPKRWEEVPLKVYDPTARLAALDEDGIDAEVLFPNTPIQGFNFTFGDPDFELEAVQAYNDAMGEFGKFSERFIPVAIIPYLHPIETVVAQVQRAVEHGHRGVVILAEPGMALKGAKHLYDRYWDPLWAVCQEMDIPINWHGSAGLANELALPHWKGFSTRQHHTVSTGRLCATPSQLIPYLLLSGILDRYPRLKWACAETGMGWMAYVLESCDHEWERRRLWTEGIVSRPSEAFRRQIYVDFWFERSGIELRDFIGIDNIMWESDYPHITSTYPNSWEHVERAIAGVPEDERQKLLYGNALRLYRLD